MKLINFVGPLPNTITDFWWLVWQEGICVVAMVTNIEERGQQKCEQYWPDQGTQKYGPFKVTLADQQVFADYTIRNLLVAVSSRRSCGNSDQQVASIVSITNVPAIFFSLNVINHLI